MHYNLCMGYQEIPSTDRFLLTPGTYSLSKNEASDDESLTREMLLEKLLEPDSKYHMRLSFEAIDDKPLEEDMTEQLDVARYGSKKDKQRAKKALTDGILYADSVTIWEPLTATVDMQEDSNGNVTQISFLSPQTLRASFWREVLEYQTSNNSPRQIDLYSPGSRALNINYQGLRTIHTQNADQQQETINSLTGILHNAAEVTIRSDTKPKLRSSYPGSKRRNKKK